MADIHQDEHLKRQYERAAAKRFLAWLRQNSGRTWVISQEREAPDFECSDSRSAEVLGLEIVTAYYNEQHAKGAWNVARGKTPSYTSDILQNPDGGLANFMTKQISTKCQKQYTVSYPIVLVVAAKPPLTTETEIQDTVLPAVRLPDQIPFQEIYLGVDLPIISESSPHEGAYWVWQLYPSPAK